MGSEIDATCERACKAFADANCLAGSERDCALQCTTERRNSDKPECQTLVNAYYECAIKNVATCGEGFPACAQIELEIKVHCEANRTAWSQIGAMVILGAGIVLWLRRRRRRFESG